MKLRSTLLPLAGLALLAPAAAASAHDWDGPYRVHYVRTYRPVVRYVPRTVIVRERVWRPVYYRHVYYRPHYYRHVYYRRVYERPYYAYGYGDGPRYDYPDWRWEDRW